MLRHGIAVCVCCVGVRIVMLGHLVYVKQGSSRGDTRSSGWLRRLFAAIFHRH
jgi:hypothetical protein